MVNSCLMLVWLCGVGTRIPSVGGLLPDVATVCPYNNFCNSNATMSGSPEEMDLTSCCQKCSCDPACQLIGNCCPDMTLMPGVEPKYPCVSLATYFNEPRGMFATPWGILLQYRIIDSCPNAVLDDAYPRCSNLVVLEDYIVVSDQVTGLLYGNIHCARCNGVNRENLTEWNLITDCNTYSSFLNIEEWHDHILRNCSLIAYPPEPSVGQLARCQRQRVFNRCNVTGNWDMYNIDLKNACELGNTNTNNMYTHELKPTPYNRIYKNVYCFLCNIRHDEVIPGQCEKTYPDVPRSFGISIFINFRQHSSEDTIKTKRCGSSQIWNPFNDSCLSVRCPIGTYAHNGKCEDLHRHLPRPAFTIMFRLKANDNNYSVELETFLGGTVTSMLANADCYQCETNIKYDGVSTYFLTYEVTSQLSCSEDFIVSKMKKFLKRSPIRLNFRNMTQITLVPELSPQDVRHFHTPLRSGLCTQMPFIVTWAIVDKCPRIPVSSLAINECTTGITTKRNGSFCVDEYFRIMASLNNSDTVAPCHMMAVVGCVLIIAIYLLI